MVGGLRCVGLCLLMRRLVSIFDQQRIQTRKYEQRGGFASQQAAENGSGERRVGLTSMFDR